LIQRCYSQSATYYLSEVNAQPPALLALSGGKDSLTALYLLADVLQVKTVAFLYQNGFIPPLVITQAQAMCDKYGVHLEILTKPLYDAFKREYPLDASGQLVARTGLDFCQLCSQQIQRLGLASSERFGAQWIVFGNKVYTQTEPYVSSIKMATINGKTRKSINLLYTLGIKTEHQKYILEQMGWQDPGLEGYTSNCLIPGLVESARQRSLKLHADQGYIERELRSGAYSWDEAQTLLQQSASSALPNPKYAQTLPASLRAQLWPEQGIES